MSIISLGESTTPGAEHPPGEDPQASRLTALQIFAAAARTGEEELRRSPTGLSFSGVAAGLQMGLSGLGAAVLANAIDIEGPLGRLLPALLYPLGFIVVVLGRSQLFTENTLFPVMLVLDQKRHVGRTLRLWGVVFAANVAGALLFATLMTQTDTLSPGIGASLVELGTEVVQGSFGSVFWAGVAGGWIIALMAWLVTATRFMMGQIALVYLTTFVVGASGLAHCIAGSGEALSAVLEGAITPGDYLMWLLAAALGNTVGGVLMVSVLNYGQVVGSGRHADRAQRHLDAIKRRV